jgi:hypothetical protein
MFVVVMETDLNVLADVALICMLCDRNRNLLEARPKWVCFENTITCEAFVVKSRANGPLVLTGDAEVPGRVSKAM